MGRGFKEALEMKLKCANTAIVATASAYVGVGGLWWGCYCTTVTYTPTATPTPEVVAKEMVGTVWVLLL